jgi:acetyl esterase/lipase
VGTTLLMARLADRIRGSARHDLSPDESRAASERFWARFPPARGTVFESATVGGVPAESVLARGATPARTILYFHGGAYTIGSPRRARMMTSRIGTAAGALVIAVRYRLAPEHVFPAAVDDAIAAYRGLLAAGVSAGRVSVAGDSAGGGLALAMLVALRDAGDGLPAAAALLSPWTDLGSPDRPDPPGGDPVISRESLADAALGYLDGADPATPLASPVHADLSGLPPVLIQVGTAELLLTDAGRTAERIEAAGGEAVLEEWEAMPHVWHTWAPYSRAARRALARVGRFLAERMG